ncbi:replication initiation factor domain-containing protein, partial [Escherichia coli]|uniref:replication initiation factor domain-containing protein n=1 Tax=Escherichia coli TaxID=562 RepID=UPI001F3077ED
VHKILSLLADEFDIRLSRLDIAIDFVDEDVLVTKIYDDLLSEELIIKNKGNRIITDDKIRTIGNSGVIQTIYVNSRKGDSFMRIYNKKEESIINNNIDMQRALECSNWTRFELELKGTYAHNATKALIDCER